jgi:AraC-like DNA-binding protein
LKPFIQKLPHEADLSFIAKTFRTPHFEVDWHQHPEYELIFFTEGNGMSFIGNYIGEFKCGDIFFIGSNVPHTFQKQEKDLIVSAVVVQFTNDFWGIDFLKIPENDAINNLFAISMKGIKFENKISSALGEMIKKLEYAKGFARISTLFNCLQLIVEEKNLTILSSRQMNLFNNKYKQRIDSIFQYTICNFQKQITLTQIAQISNMSITAFCSYFKKSTKKSYIQFLNEIRIGYACTLLQETEKSIIDICYESGYNTTVNFNKQFLKIKKTTPGKYRNQLLRIHLNPSVPALSMPGYIKKYLP